MLQLLLLFKISAIWSLLSAPYALAADTPSKQIWEYCRFDAVNGSVAHLKQYSGKVPLEDPEGEECRKSCWRWVEAKKTQDLISPSAPYVCIWKNTNELFAIEDICADFSFPESATLIVIYIPKDKRNSDDRTSSFIYDGKTWKLADWQNFKFVVGKEPSSCLTKKWWNRDLQMTRDRRVWGRLKLPDIHTIALHVPAKLKGKPFVLTNLEKTFQDPSDWKSAKIDMDEDLAKNEKLIKKYIAKDGRKLLVIKTGAEKTSWIMVTARERKILFEAWAESALIDAGDYDGDGKSEFVFFAGTLTSGGVRVVDEVGKNLAEENWGDSGGP